MSTTSPQRYLPVRFEGAWTDEDRALIRRAIGRLGTRGGTALAPSGLAWLCVCHVRPSGLFYFAHWLRRPLVLTAHTAEELAGKIEALRPDAAAS